MILLEKLIYGIKQFMERSWKQENFLNIFPKLGSTVAKFFGELFTDVFNSIYNQQIDQKSVRNVILGFFILSELQLQ